MTSTAVVIMAGGSGTRFWPLSRKKRPKQLLSLFSKNTMLEDTIQRFKGLVDEKDIFVATNSTIASAIHKTTPKTQLIVEPESRNTAAAIGYSATKLLKKYGPDAVMIVETSDHIYDNKKLYHQHLKKAIYLAHADKLVLLGIKPTYANTGFGYIKLGRLYSFGAIKSYRVDRFIEKPDSRRAKLFIRNPKNVWNSGVFVVRVGRILNEISLHMPKLAKNLKVIYDSGFDSKTIKSQFNTLPSISIDYGVIEKSKNLVCIKADLNWDDIGDLSKLDQLKKQDIEKNIFHPLVVSHDTKNTTVLTKKLTATIGVENLIIIETDDALLVCDKSHVQDVKKIVNKLKDKNKKYL